MSHAAQSHSPDDAVLYGAEQIVAWQSQLLVPPQRVTSQMQSASQSRPAEATGQYASTEEFVCMPPAMEEDHVVHMVRADHHPLHVLIAPTPHRADRHQSHVLIAPTPHCAGFTLSSDSLGAAMTSSRPR